MGTMRAAGPSFAEAPPSPKVTRDFGRFSSPVARNTSPSRMALSRSGTGAALRMAWSHPSSEKRKRSSGALDVSTAVILSFGSKKV